MELAVVAAEAVLKIFIMVVFVVEIYGQKMKNNIMKMNMNIQ